ncbi:hypothetical protein GGX14DRAFT_478115 [Mycena pura]|uniref:Uncharacterized protein n=1 Tax=Mycena pura TaxID=153505 RepID=A0AAD6US19_9AGAR|nr:hypothetical protein GGX14DRAFT_478115 [Mycena pura]
MTRTSPPLKTWCTVFGIVLLLSLFVAPAILEQNPQTANLAAALDWAKDMLAQGFTTLCILAAVIVVLSLVYDLKRWLTRTPPPAPAPTPSALEEGTAPAPSHPPAEAAAASPPDHAPESESDAAQVSITNKLLSLVSTGWLVWYEFRRRGILSREKPPLENGRAALLFVFRGLEVLLVGLVLLVLLVLVAVVWLRVRKRPRASGAEGGEPASPAETFFDEEVSIAEVADAEVEETEGVEGKV